MNEIKKNFIAKILREHYGDEALEEAKCVEIAGMAVASDSVGTSEPVDVDVVRWFAYLHIMGKDMLEHPDLLCELTEEQKRKLNIACSNYKNPDNTDDETIEACYEAYKMFIDANTD